MTAREEALLAAVRQALYVSFDGRIYVALREDAPLELSPEHEAIVKAAVEDEA